MGMFQIEAKECYQIYTIDFEKGISFSDALNIAETQ